jgi:hypothetical protein
MTVCRCSDREGVGDYAAADSGERPAAGLFHRPRTGNKDIDQPSRAWLPVRAGRDIGDADDGPKKINRVEVLTYVAALDRALHECAKRFMNLGVGRFEHLLGVANQRIQPGQ